MNSIMESVASISLAIVGVATLAVLVSRNANTAGVIRAYGQTFAQMVGAATGPVSGSGMTGLGVPSLPQMGSGWGYNYS